MNKQRKMNLRPVPPAWLKNYAALESAALVLSYTGPRVGYNKNGAPQQWFLCKCNHPRRLDHQNCPHVFKYLDLPRVGAVDVLAWIDNGWNK